MSQKTEKPVLSGQRIKTRKRDEKEKYDPTGFREAVLQGLQDSPVDVDQIYKFLDVAGSKLDYRRYGEPLFDILIAGGILAPGGSLVQEAENRPYRTESCIFGLSNDRDTIRSFAQVFIKLMRRYKYLEKMFEEEMKKILIFLKGFGPEDRSKLAKATAVWLACGTLPPSCLTHLLQEHLVKDGIALDYLLEVLVMWKDEKDVGAIKANLKRAGLDNRLLEFFPVNKRSQENFHALFKEKGLLEIVEFQRSQANAEIKREMQKEIDRMVKEEEPPKEILALVKEMKLKQDMDEKEIIVILWLGVMGAVEWNKKEELVAEQAMKHLKTYAPLFSAFTSSAKAESALLVKMQEYCYDNMSFMKVFQKIVLLFYKTDVLSEDAIMKWYKETHSTKGKSIFLEQMKKFVEWLQNAEEGEYKEQRLIPRRIESLLVEFSGSRCTLIWYIVDIADLQRK
ncbi:unnamed protein product [Darwinula stevensoni]|uniref:W2 domain-containing protein n=1 Tax=Darwinula stevensoni TaxID=69355 RepID=A0A7R8XG66_9CRUS|nr:unnamed protein product [Darwinula stevensoni]CAG0889444.1 unnamed protein product [Darwinula stevensoni]